MSTPHDNIAHRVAELERFVDGELQRIVAETTELPMRGRQQQVWLAKTTKGQSEDVYPANAPGNDTFNLDIVDGWFPHAVGAQTPTLTARGSHAIGHNIRGVWVPENTLVLAVQQVGLNAAGDGHWWFDVPDSVASTGTTVCVVRFQLTTALGYGAGQTATATVLSCSGDCGALESTITVEDFTQGLFRGRIGYEGIAYKYAEDVACNWTIINLEEQAEVIRATMTAAFDGTPGDTVAGTLVDWWQGVEPPAAVTLKDACGNLGNLPYDSCVLASYDEILDLYTVISGPHCQAATADCHRTTDYNEVEAGGWTPATSLPCVDQIRVNEDTLLKLYSGTDAGDQVALVSLDVPCDESPLYMGGGLRQGGQVVHSDGVSIRWTAKPWLGRGFTTGVFSTGPVAPCTPPAWWKQIGPSCAPGTTEEFWLGTYGGVSQHWLVPTLQSHGQGTNSVLYYRANSPNSTSNQDGDYPYCTRLDWTERGVGAPAGETDECVITLLDSDYEPVDIAVHAGVIYSIKNNSAHSTAPDATRCVVPDDPRDAVCPDDAPGVPTPCDPCT